MNVLKRILKRMFCQHDYAFEAEVVETDTISGFTKRTLICCCKKCHKPIRLSYKNS